jgi:hypothetical protein
MTVLKMGGMLKELTKRREILPSLTDTDVRLPGFGNSPHSLWSEKPTNPGNGSVGHSQRMEK